MSRGNGLEPAAQAEGQTKRRAIVSRDLPFVAVYVDAPRHPKIDDLAALVGTAPAALGYVVALWTFAAEFYGDGRIPNRPGVVATFERMARWTGEPGALVAALVEAHLLDSSRHILTVHDWSDYQSAHVERRAREAAVKRRRRAEKRRNGAQTQEVRPGDVPPNVPPQTKPSQTKLKLSQPAIPIHDRLLRKQPRPAGRKKAAKRAETRTQDSPDSELSWRPDCPCRASE
jgi:hypothetical protein